MIFFYLEQKVIEPQRTPRMAARSLLAKNPGGGFGQASFSFAATRQRKVFQSFASFAAFLPGRLVAA